MAFAEFKSPGGMCDAIFVNVDEVCAVEKGRDTKHVSSTHIHLTGGHTVEVQNPYAERQAGVVKMLEDARRKAMEGDKDYHLAAAGVVRCAHCTHSKYNIFSGMMCERTGTGQRVNETDFCSHGKPPGAGTGKGGGGTWTIGG